MKSYIAVAVLAVLVGANAQSGDPPCSKQMELEHRCMLNIETSPEAQMVKDRMKEAMKTCAPDFPQECHAQFEAAHDCMTTIAKNSDDDPLFKESKSKSQPAVDECFVKYPVDIKNGIMEIFMMGKPPGPPHGGFHHKEEHGRGHHNATSSSGEAGGASGEKVSGEKPKSSESSSNETSMERKHHGGGGCHGRGHRCRPHRHHGPRSGSSEARNETSASASKEHGHKGGMSGGKSGGRSGGKSGEKPQCRKTKEQKSCMKQEMKKLANDTAFVNVINTLIHQKHKCKQVVQWSCSTKCPKKQKCIFKATKPCREVFMGKMKTCMQEKGFTLPPHMMREHTAAFTTPMPDIRFEQ